MEKLSKSKSMDIALSFAKHLFSKDEYQEKNTIFSPLSLQAALSVMAAGSQGCTLDEILSFLRFDSVDHLTAFYAHLLSAVFSDDDGANSPSSHHLTFANGVLADDSVSLSHSFKQLVATHYKATLASVDFQTKGDQVLSEVNSLIEKGTHGLITQLLPPSTTVTNLTRLIFANALRFLGSWKHKFDQTRTLRFCLLNGTFVEVPFMNSKKKTQYISAFDGFKILRLPYKQGRDTTRRFSMYIFLPDAVDGLPSLIEKLSSESGFLKGKLPRQKVRVGSFWIPQFTISSTFEASNVLKEVGVVSPFSQCDADFTKMVDMNSPLDKFCVESIFHKAFIEVNEKGTEAGAGATSTFWVAHCWTHPGVNFVASRPFLFLIREDFTGTIIFVGQVLNPLVGSPVKKLSGLLELRRQFYKERHSSVVIDDDKPKRKR